MPSSGKTVKAGGGSIRGRSEAPGGGGGEGGEGKIGRQRTGDAELPRKSDYILYADVIEKAHGGNVTRIGESAAIGDAAFESVVVIMRRIILGAAAVCDGLVHDGIKRRNALFDGVGVNVNLERAAGLAQGLRGAIEFRFVETVAADHGFDFAGGIVDGEQGALSGGLLFELDAHGEAGNFLDRNADEISRLEQLRGGFAAGPGKIGGSEHGVILADLDGSESRLNRGDQAGNVIVFLKRVVPLVVLIFIERAKFILQNIREISAPAVAAIVRM